MKSLPFRLAPFRGLLGLFLPCGMNLALANSVVLYETGFERFEGYDSHLDLVGQSEWFGEGTGGNGILPPPIEGFNGQVAYIGFTPPSRTHSTFNLWRPIGLNPLPPDRPVVQFSVSMQIQDSTTAAPYFDEFRWSVYGIDGTRFFSLDFDNDSREIFYILDEKVPAAEAFHSTRYTFSNGRPYDLTVQMDLARNLWTASINGAILVSGQKMTTSAAPLTIGDIDAVWVVRDPAKPGDNFMIFDDYRMEITPMTEIAPRLEVLGFSSVRPSFLVKVWGEPGVTYLVEATTDGIHWVPREKKTASMLDGSVVFEDTQVGTMDGRLYRATSVGQ